MVGGGKKSGGMIRKVRQKMRRFWEGGGDRGE